QTLFGLKKLVLNNGHQDLSFLSAHLVYELFRRADLVAPHTAFAQVTINGISAGLYNIEEESDSQLFSRSYGPGAGAGNFYEGTTTGFVADPFGAAAGALEGAGLRLNNEASDMRSRDDIIGLGRAILGVSDARFDTEVGKLFDLDRFITARAIEAATR